MGTNLANPAPDWSTHASRSFMISHQQFFLGGVLVHDGVVGEGGEGFIINTWGLRNLRPAPTKLVSPEKA